MGQEKTLLKGDNEEDVDGGDGSAEEVNSGNCGGGSDAAAGVRETWKKVNKLQRLPILIF